MVSQVPQDLWTAKKALVCMRQIQSSLEPKVHWSISGFAPLGKCFRIRFESRDDYVSVDRFTKIRKPIVSQAALSPGRTIVT